VSAAERERLVSEFVAAALDRVRDRAPEGEPTVVESPQAADERTRA